MELTDKVDKESVKKIDVPSENISTLFDEVYVANTALYGSGMVTKGQYFSKK